MIYLQLYTLQNYIYLGNNFIIVTKYTSTLTLKSCAYPIHYIFFKVHILISLPTMEISTTQVLSRDDFSRGSFH